MQQETGNRADAVDNNRRQNNRRQNNRLWWLGGVGAVATGLKVYSDYIVYRTKAKSSPVGEFVTVEGIRLHYVRRGMGQPVVLLHGSGLVLQDFTQSLFTALAADYQAIAFDRPGYGYSERPEDEPLTLSLNARLIHAALGKLGIDRPILVGHSSGASVALRYALDYPDAVAGLVLTGPSAYAEGQSVPPFFYITDLPIVGEIFLHTVLVPLVQIIAGQFAAGLFAPNDPPQGYVEMLKTFAIRRSHFRTHAAELKHLLAGLRAQSPHYDEITIPVAILSGEDDQIDPPATQAIPLQAALPDAKLVTVSGGGHAVHHENPELVLAMIQHVQHRYR